MAVVKTNFARVRLRPDSNSPEIGLLREGATVTVTACQTDCVTSRGWGAPFGTDGAIKLDLLEPQTVQDQVAAPPSAEALWYGRVGKSGITIFKEPRRHGAIVTRKHLSREMAFLPNVALRKNGWLQRADGGFVRARLVETLTPSSFHGEAQPHLPLAFAVRELRGSPADMPNGLHRYDRFPVRDVNGVRVAMNGGFIPRNATRIITLHAPPRMIPAGAKWVFVDLAQQTLTAYEGETPVYAR